VPHIFGEEVERKLTARKGWLTAGVASSIPWPSSDVCVVYAGDEYFLRGKERAGKQSPPCITIACEKDGQDEAISKIYRFTSILSWFLGGYVDVSGYVSGSVPILYGSQNVYSSLGIVGSKSFNCNHMPVIEQQNVRKALAFWREGKRLDEVHGGYAFLSFYKVIESQFSDGKAKADWITANIEGLTGRAALRVAELRAQGIDVSRHLFDSGRCAVAHASLDGEIVDPDIPADRQRLSSDLVIIEELASIFIRDELKVPDSRSLYRTRDRLEPWASLISSDRLDILKKGGTPKDVAGLTGRIVSIGLWPDGPIPGLERMTMQVGAVENGIVKIVLINERKTISSIFFLDFPSGQAHTNLEEGGFYGENKPDENDVRAYATFFYNVVANGIAELTCEDREPVDCEVVIPVNIMMTKSVDEAIADDVERFRKENAEPDASGRREV
jgi:Methylamine utilization protein MauJ